MGRSSLDHCMAQTLNNSIRAQFSRWTLVRSPVGAAVAAGVWHHFPVLITASLGRNFPFWGKQLSTWWRLIIKNWQICPKEIPVGDSRILLRAKLRDGLDKHLPQLKSIWLRVNWHRHRPGLDVSMDTKQPVWVGSGGWRFEVESQSPWRGRPEAYQAERGKSGSTSCKWYVKCLINGGDLSLIFHPFPHQTIRQWLIRMTLSGFKELDVFPCL